LLGEQTDNSVSISLLDRAATLRHVVETGCSVARFGDGEMYFALHGLRWGFKGINFQKPNRHLTRILNEILERSIDRLLVCYNNQFMQEDNYKIVLDYERNPSKEYSEYLSIKRDKDIGVLRRERQRKIYNRQFETLRKKTFNRLFGDATFFILCFYFEEYIQNRILEICDLYRKMLDGKNILIVAPEKPVLGVSFRQLCEQGIIRSPERVEFISIPEKNCFEYYEQLLLRIESCRWADTVLVQAGPTATVLAEKLTSSHGITTYDVGTWNVSLQKAAQIHGITF